MKRIIIYSISTLIILASSCTKKELDQVNPNEPTPTGSLSTEAGITAYGAGILQRTIFDVPNAGASNIYHIAVTNHSLLGDEMFLPYGNYGFRWVNQVYQITLPNGTVITNPIGVTHQASLQGFNSRAAGDRNAFMYEWTICYFFIQQANQMLASLEKGIAFSGDAATKKAALQAWAYWWKAYSYSRIGSMYLAGIINNNPNGNTNASFIHHDAIIAESNKQYDNCIAVLATLPAAGNDDYNEILKSLIVSFNDPNKIVSPEMWKRQINTLKARNLLANKKVVDMTATDWNQIIALCNDGVKSSDNYFKWGMTSDGNNDLSNGWMHPLAFTGPQVQWTFISERFVQEFKVGDDRFTKGIIELPLPPAKDPTYDLSAFTNIRSRGYQFGTRWAAKPIEDGGIWATGNNTGFVPFGASYEENALMLGEALINSNQIDNGLSYVDEVRAFQNSMLPNVKGTGLNLADAKEELRRERRIALFQRGLAFYDARRLGFTTPVSKGGGRQNGIVFAPGAVVGDPPRVLSCLMDYSYMDYWDVPANELDFNTPANGSASVANPK